jgi:integrase
MVLLELSKHLERGLKYNKLSPKSILNYQQAMHYFGLSVVDTDDLVKTWHVILGKLRSGGSAELGRLLVILIFTNAKPHGDIKILNTPELTEIMDIIGSKPKQNRTGYRTQDVRLILKTAYDRGTFPLFRLLALLAMSGARISSLEGLTLSDIKPVPTVEGTYYFQLTSKGRTYNAVIGQNAYDWIQVGLDSYEEPICPYSRRSEHGTFDRSYRMKFLKLIDANNLRGIYNRVNEVGMPLDVVVFHAFRKWHARTLFRDGISPTEIDLLQGRSGNKIVFKNYLDDSGQRQSVDILPRAGKAYAKSSLMDFSFEEAMA